MVYKWLVLLFLMLNISRLNHLILLMSDASFYIGNFIWFNLIVKGVGWGGGVYERRQATEPRPALWGWGALPPGGREVNLQS